MISHVQPGPTAIQLSGYDEQGKTILSVLCKRTYDVLGDGRTVVSDTQEPLQDDFEPDPDNPKLLARDTDLYPCKALTDVVVRGHAHGTGQRSFIATVQVGTFKKEVAVTGNRRCTVTPTGRIVFSEAEKIEKIPLRYDRAYGGLDSFAQEVHGNPLAPLVKYLNPEVDISGATPYAYPRNFAGVGYLIEPIPAAVERLVLPNLEDPSDRLAPDRLAVGSPLRWPLMPIPHSFGWVDPGTFPRLAYAGIVHDHERLSAPIAEVQRGYAPPDILAIKSIAEKASLRFTNGASLGLQMPHLRGGEECLLGGVHPRAPVWRFHLPKDHPEIQTDGRNGTLKRTRPVIHTVDIEPDRSRLSIVWRGSAEALRPYGAEELKEMPFLVRWS